MAIVSSERNASFRIFDGPHRWPPPEFMEEALTWFRIQAMKKQLEARDRTFIEAQFAKACARAESFEQSGDLLNAQQIYVLPPGAKPRARS